MDNLMLPDLPENIFRGFGSSVSPKGECESPIFGQKASFVLHRNRGTRVLSHIPIRGGKPPKVISGRSGAQGCHMKVMTSGQGKHCSGAEAHSNAPHFRGQSPFSLYLYPVFLCHCHGIFDIWGGPFMSTGSVDGAFRCTRYIHRFQLLKDNRVHAVA